jgi:hypothetical protein
MGEPEVGLEDEDPHKRVFFEFNELDGGARDEGLREIPLGVPHEDAIQKRHIIGVNHTSHPGDPYSLFLAGEIKVARVSRIFGANDHDDVIRSNILGVEKL